jgi:putative salt-induced outer membrane protein YdiY
MLMQESEITHPSSAPNTKPNSVGRRWAMALTFTLVCAGHGVASAQNSTNTTATLPAVKTNVWVTTAAAALTLTRGNSKTFLVTLSLDAKAKWKKNEAVLGVSGGYGESTVNGVNSKNTEFVQGFGQFNHLFTDRFYGAFRLDGQYDGIAGVEYRFKLSPLAGYYLIKNKRMMLAAEAGPSLILEHLIGHEPDAYWAARLAERFEYKLSASTRVWDTIEYLPKVNDWDANYLINIEAGIETAVNKHWSLRVVFQDMYASEPASGRESNDLRLMAGTAYKF